MMFDNRHAFVFFLIFGVYLAPLGYPLASFWGTSGDKLGEIWDSGAERVPRPPQEAIWGGFWVPFGTLKLTQNA